MFVGFDIGGTFTDFVFYDNHTRNWTYYKTSSTPGDLTDGCITGLQEHIREINGSLADISYVGHGTTVATNIVIERRGAKTALLTTDGFQDILDIRRQIMPSRYDMRVRKPEPLVPRYDRVGVLERTLADGTIEMEVDRARLQEALGQLLEQGIESVAICFLHSYANPTNEMAAEQEATAAGDWFVSASHQVMNEFREFERTSTTVVNAYIGPPMQRYLERLEGRVREVVGTKVPVQVFQSNGGVASAQHVGEFPVGGLLSGPAAGVVAAQAVAAQIDLPNFVSLDMGGTSCDVALVRDGRASVAYEQDVSGWPVHTARVNIETVGAGGGSIASIQPGGLIQVGPRSAGARPGPACYGNGGQAATVTDANLVLGRLGTNQLLAGRMPLRPDLAEATVEELASRTGTGVTEAAIGIIDVANSTMARAIRLVSVERGYDPAQFGLVSFGGAGGLHAAELAQDVGMPMVVVPPHPGVMCALGLLVADLRVDRSMTYRSTLSATNTAALLERMARLAQDAHQSRAVLARPEVEWDLQFSVDMRYSAQSFELTVPFTTVEVESEGVAVLGVKFDAAHEQRYGFMLPSDEKDIVAIRLALRGPSGVSLDSTNGDSATDERQAAPTESIETRRVYFRRTGWLEVPVWQRDGIPTGRRLIGPAIVEQMDATTVVPPDVEFEVDTHANLIMRLDGGA